MKQRKEDQTLNMKKIVILIIMVKRLQNIDQSEWKQVLVNITMQHMEANPDYIYKEFHRVMREERGISDDDLPSKEKVKGKISYTRASLKKKLKR